MVNLNMPNCHGVTDRGIKFLCENPLKNLRAINVLNTKLTMRGSVDLIITYANLVEFSHENSIVVVHEAIKRLSSNTESFDVNLHQRKLRSLKFSFDAYMSNNFERGISRETIELVSKFCPQATFVELYAIGDNSNLLALSNFKNLQKLELVSDYMNDQFQINFKGLSNLLSIIGIQLIELILHGIIMHSLETIGNFCANLQRLDISSCYDPEMLDKEFVPENATAFRKLRSFYFADAAEPKFSFHETSFSTLFERAELLEKLVLHNVRTVTNNTITKAVAKHSFSRLREMSLEGCHGIDGQAIFSLLTADNDLSELRMHHCNMIYMRDFEKFVIYCRKQNLKISLKWS